MLWNKPKPPTKWGILSIDLLFWILCSLGIKSNEQSCQPVTLKKSIIELKKTYFEVKKSIFARRARIMSVKRASQARSPFGRGQGPGSTQVLGALWCNLSLIFEHYY